MDIRALLAAGALVIASAVSVQAQCSHGKSQQVMSCAEGTVWDAEAKTCVPQTTS